MDRCECVDVASININTPLGVDLTLGGVVCQH